MNIIYYVIIAIIIIKLPVIGVYFRLINTFIHEVFHVLMAKVTGGKGHRITLNQDTSGVAVTSSASWLSRVLTAYAGYTGSSFAALFLFYLLHESYYTAVLSLVTAMLIIATVLWVRNGFGLLWSISFCVLLWFLVDKQHDELIIHLSYLLASILLVESILSAGQIMVLSIKQPRQAGDATALQKSTLIPAVIWGALFFGQSIYVGYVVVGEFIV